ncbi:MAG: hypothetical protein LBS19_05745 [Clostridiales bacterium]|jgi:hypothetical protein|nr:hypothetical protein [Clostridiales bacterium]
MTAESDEFVEAEVFTVGDDTEFHEEALPDGVYGFMYIITDYSNAFYSSEMVGITIEDGAITIFGAK